MEGRACSFDCGSGVPGTQRWSAGSLLRVTESDPERLLTTVVELL